VLIKQTHKPETAIPTTPRLARVIHALKRHHGVVAAPPVADPYLLLLWEHVGCLADDPARHAAFQLLETTIGTTPHAITAAPLAVLKHVTRTGGKSGFDIRAKRLRATAARAAMVNGNLISILTLPRDEAVHELMRYPSISRPDAERILLLCGAYAPLAPDSNGVRVLLRLGYGRNLGRYDRTYDMVQAAAERELRSSVPARRAAHLVLRKHGATLCRKLSPLCLQCPVLSECPTGRMLVARKEQVVGRSNHVTDP
jgi:endonuclease III